MVDIPTMSDLSDQPALQSGPELLSIIHSENRIQSREVCC
jgi:hypothetical protein